MSKKIRVEGHDAIFIDREIEVPWADAWISWTEKPGRKRTRFGPTLIGAYDLRGELVIERELAQENPDMPEFAESVKRYEEILQRLEGGQKYHVDLNDPNDGCPNIYTARDGIDRAEAERMIAVFLETKGIHDPQFKWIRPKIVVQGISFGHLAEKAA